MSEGRCEESGPGESDVKQITDIHIHIQPWNEMRKELLQTLREAHGKEFDFLMELMSDPALLLEYLDDAGIDRAGLINYPSPDVTGFTEKTNEFSARYAAHHPGRLLPFGGVHPRLTDDPAAAVDRLVDLGIRCLKIHPPHQAYAANAYTEGLHSLADIYRRAEDHGLPVMIHTGTSLFPGARCKFGRPMEIDDVALDFPDLRIIMAHGGRPLWTEEAFFIMRRHRNVWLDLSGIPPVKILSYFPRIEELADRVLWGTDWPSPGVRSPGHNLDQFRKLDLPEHFKEKATIENPMQIFPEIS